MYYQHQDKKAWLGPVRVFSVKGNDIFICANGSVRKVANCNIQICERENEEDEQEREGLKNGGSSSLGMT